MHTEILEMLSFIKEKAQLNYEQSGHLVPVLFLNTKEGLSISGIVTDDFVDVKDQIAIELRQLIAEDNLYEYAFLSEAWAVKTQDMSDIDKWLKAHGTLKGYPGYKEIISLSYASPTQEIIASSFIEDKKLVLPWEEIKQMPVDIVKSQAKDMKGYRLSGLWAEHNVQFN